jgi:hypothetical protein
MAIALAEEAVGVARIRSVLVENGAVGRV